MSTIKIEDIAFVRFRAPDLVAMRSFLEDFGFVIAPHEPDRLVARGFGSAPALHVTEPGEPAFAGLALRAASADDLERLAEAEGATLEPLELPGGGRRIVLSDPDGHRIEVVAGQAPARRRPHPAEAPWNSADVKERVRLSRRVAHGPSHVVRLGHVVLNVSDFRRSEAWYKERFGFITSDEIRIPPETALGAFLRCDRGATPTDHHTLFLAQSPKGPGFNHAAFEVVDLDDLMVGHQHLSRAGRAAEWGVGRHILGSQVFDYWRDPWGHTLEHWTDGDLFTAADPSGIATVNDLLGVQWGPAPPATMA
jgi:catechol 2,3-dioxygenase-like lactoylglutathione lyase family enzyme